MLKPGEGKSFNRDASGLFEAEMEKQLNPEHIEIRYLDDGNWYMIQQGQVICIGSTQGMEELGRFLFQFAASQKERGTE